MTTDQLMKGFADIVEDETRQLSGVRYEGEITAAMWTRIDRRWVTLLGMNRPKEERRGTGTRSQEAETAA